MEIPIKIASRDYEQLRAKIPDGSTAREPVERATRIDYSVGGVLFEGYSILCDEPDARALLQIARNSCPQIAPRIEEAIRLANSAES